MSIPRFDRAIDNRHLAGEHEGEGFDPISCVACRADGERELGRLGVWAPPRIIRRGETPDFYPQAHQPDWWERHGAHVERWGRRLRIIAVVCAIAYILAQLVRAIITGGIQL